MVKRKHIPGKYKCLVHKIGFKTMEAWHKHCDDFSHYGLGVQYRDHKRFGLPRMKGGLRRFTMADAT